MSVSPATLHDQDQTTTQQPPGSDHQRPSSAEASTQAVGRTESNTTQSKTAEKHSIESNQHESLAFSSDPDRYQSSDFAELDDDPFFGADFNAELGSPAFLDERTLPDRHGLEQDAESNPYPLVPEPATSRVGTNFIAPITGFLHEHTWHNLYESDLDAFSNFYSSVAERAAPMPPSPRAITSPRVPVSTWGNELPVQTAQGTFEYNLPTALGDFRPVAEWLPPTQNPGRQINGDINRLRDDRRKVMDESWPDDEMYDMSTKLGEKPEKSANLCDPPDVLEDQNPFDYETKDGHIQGQSNYNTGGEMSEQDMNPIMSNRNWKDAPVLHSASRGQPETSQAAMARFEKIMHDTDAISSRSATWGARRRRSLPSLVETDVLANSGSDGLLKKISPSRENERNNLEGLLRDAREKTRRPKASQSNKRTHSNVYVGESRPTSDLSSAVFKHMHGPHAGSSKPLIASATPQANELRVSRSWSNDPNSYDLRALFKEPVDVADPPKHIPPQNPSLNQHESVEVDSKMVEPDYDISLTRGLSSASKDSWKRSIEHIAGCPLSWWPLSDPEDELQSGYTRVYSMPFAMSTQNEQRFYDDIPTPLAETMFPKLVGARGPTQRSGWTASSPKAVLLRDTTLMRLLNRQGDSDARQQQPSGPGKRRPGETRDTEGGDQRLQDLGDRSLQERNNETPAKNPILFISSDITSNESVAGTVELGENDATTIRNLRAAFRRLPSRGWKRATGIKFYRFQSFHFKPSLKRRYVVVDKDKERYPEEADPEYVSYNYDPRPWEDGKPCPCLSGEAWFFFKNPDECCSSKQLNRALPVRLNDTNDSRITAWGIHIEQRHSAWAIFIPAIALAIVTLAATFWFIPQWLKDHPGDLQNATVPAVIAFGVMQLLIQLLASLLIFRWSV